MAGRDQREPMERLTRVLAVLTSAGSSGVPVDHLVDIAGFTSADAEARRDQLKREIRHLTQQGWEITNIADEGAPAIYRLATVDNRLRIKLTPGQAAELQRAVLFASRADLVDRLGLLQGALDEDLPAEVTTAGADQTLDLVVEAVRMSCLLRFRYGGTDRAVHPQTVRTTGGRWYLLAHEERSDQVKTFVVSRMSGVSPDEPGTAQVDPVVRHRGLHPLSWQVDSPIEVVLETPVEFRDDVVNWLATPLGENLVERDGTQLVHLTYSVTNRQALIGRVCDLGRRVRIVAPESLRTELITLLEDLAGAGATHETGA